MAEPLVLDAGELNRSGLRAKVFEILKTVLQATDEPPPSTTAAALRQLVQTNDAVPQRPELLFDRDFFLPFHSVAWQVPYQELLQDRVIRILSELRNEFAKPKVVDHEVTLAWDDQHVLDETFAETYDVRMLSLQWYLDILLTSVLQSIVHTAVPGLSMEDDAARRINFHSYAAKLTEAGLILNDKYCIFAFADALEGQHSGKIADAEHAEPSTMVLDVEARVTIATEWIRHAARTIYKKQSSVWGAVHGPLITWNERGFSKARWALWKSRLSMIEMNTFLSENTRVRAGQAVQKMNEVEREPQTPLRLGFLETSGRNG
ncbi:hypothetical protein KEM56_004226 [Ascosphaera pollenicola]|nr:hypothetical protein KEM56_004226 [Ascosphaera pollenicola]